ncbi:hypothetical protein BC831DRAFT_882 [Entophlyctis helioformis]|nr:hypothetical protein BC831DRAFT_882 [Entophlyctis helioformis]
MPSPPPSHSPEVLALLETKVSAMAVRASTRMTTAAIHAMLNTDALTAVTASASPHSTATAKDTATATAAAPTDGTTKSAAMPSSAAVAAEAVSTSLSTQAQRTPAMATSSAPPAATAPSQPQPISMGDIDIVSAAARVYTTDRHATDAAPSSSAMDALDVAEQLGFKLIKPLPRKRVSSTNRVHVPPPPDMAAVLGKNAGAAKSTGKTAVAAKPAATATPGGNGKPKTAAQAVRSKAGLHKGGISQSAANAIASNSRIPRAIRALTARPSKPQPVGNSPRSAAAPESNPTVTSPAASESLKSMDESRDSRDMPASKRERNTRSQAPRRVHFGISPSSSPSTTAAGAAGPAGPAIPAVPHVSFDFSCNPVLPPVTATGATTTAAMTSTAVPAFSLAGLTETASRITPTTSSDHVPPATSLLQSLQSLSHQSSHNIAALPPFGRGGFSTARPAPGPLPFYWSPSSSIPSSWSIGVQTAGLLSSKAPSWLSNTGLSSHTTSKLFPQSMFEQATASAAMAAHTAQAASAAQAATTAPTITPSLQKLGQLFHARAKSRSSIAQSSFKEYNAMISKAQLNPDTAKPRLGQQARPAIGSCVAGQHQQQQQSMPLAGLSAIGAATTLKFQSPLVVQNLASLQGMLDLKQDHLQPAIEQIPSASATPAAAAAQPIKSTPKPTPPFVWHAPAIPVSATPAAPPALAPVQMPPSAPPTTPLQNWPDSLHRASAAPQAQPSVPVSPQFKFEFKPPVPSVAAPQQPVFSFGATAPLKTAKPPVAESSPAAAAAAFSKPPLAPIAIPPFVFTGTAPAKKPPAFKFSAAPTTAAPALPAKPPAKPAAPAIVHPAPNRPAPVASPPAPLAASTSTAVPVPAPAPVAPVAPAPAASAGARTRPVLTDQEKLERQARISRRRRRKYLKALQDDLWVCFFCEYDACFRDPLPRRAASKLPPTHAQAVETH